MCAYFLYQIKIKKQGVYINLKKYFLALMASSVFTFIVDAVYVNVPPKCGFAIAFIGGSANICLLYDVVSHGRKKENKNLKNERGM